MCVTVLLGAGRPSVEQGDHDIKRQLIKLWTIFLSGGGGGGSGFWTLAHTDLTQKLRVDFDEKFLACLFQ